jgi:histidinol-phosphate aminotransferase
MSDPSSLHGGPDAEGLPRWDFSTNANACGPAPLALAAVQEADPRFYPDPHYTQLRRALGDFHGVDAQRIGIAASASEFIQRLSMVVALHQPGAAVAWPQPGYGDYGRAALAAGLSHATAANAALLWHTAPSSPLGELQPLPPHRNDAIVVLDRAYAPLQLSGVAPEWPGAAWQLHSPNKALGLTGVRAAYAVAPDTAAAMPWLQRLHALAPSWPIGAHGVAMLQAWVHPDVQTWIHQSLHTLRDWKAAQFRHCLHMGWYSEPSHTPFFVAHWPSVDVPPALLLKRLRNRGVKLRDATPLGLLGAVRLSVQPPQAQQALVQAWQEAVAQPLSLSGRASGSAPVTP